MWHLLMAVVAIWCHCGRWPH